jgi:hypothetical protein
MDAGERFGRLEERMNRVEAGVSNFRDFQVDVRAFITRQDTREEERKAALAAQEAAQATQREAVKEALDGATRKQGRRDFWLTVVLAVLGLILSLLIYLEGNRQIHRGILKIPDIFHSEIVPSVYARGNEPQDSENPGDMSYGIAKP